ncbi:MAG: cell division protein FtsL [Lachnospiraceae bacterium]|jgi:cell division protein FtsL|nr:cell division protein FtsL [Lachnospiraceae bacterium]
MVKETNRRQVARQQYVYGSAAPKVDIRREMEEERRVHRVSQTTKKNREHVHSMSPAYVFVLLLCLCTALCVIIWYVNLQSQVTSKVSVVNQLESKLNNMKQANDEENLRIQNSVDLEEIKRIAIGELGMTYAQEGQIVYYSSEGTDYMRKVVED